MVNLIHGRNTNDHYVILSPSYLRINSAKHLISRMKDSSLSLRIVDALANAPKRTNWPLQGATATKRSNLSYLRQASRVVKIWAPPPLWGRTEVEGITPILTFPRQGGRDFRKNDIFLAVTNESPSEGKSLQGKTIRQQRGILVGAGQAWS